MSIQHIETHASPVPMPSIIGRPDEEQILEENLRLKEEVQRMAERQTEVMRLLNCRSPEKIVHDLRNVLNEVNLYKSLLENEV